MASSQNPASQKNANSGSETVWDYKPWWCQPWSILLTGFGAIAGSWLLLHRIWLTGLVTVPMVSWMGFFILLFPKLAAESGLLDEMRAYHAAELEQVLPGETSESDS